MNTAISRKIKTAVDALIPASREYKIYSSPTGFDDMEVIRVITSAWSNRGKAERITKVQNAVMENLGAEEKKRIFRFSVLTPAEWDGIRMQFAGEKLRQVGSRRRRAKSPR